MLYLIAKGDMGGKMDYRFFIAFITSILILSLVVFADPIGETTGNITTGEQQSGGVNVTANASATTTTTTAAPSPTTSTTAASVSSGGGGGGGVTIITSQETKTISLIPAGGTTTVAITKSDTLKIDLIEIEVKNEVKNVEVTVKESSKPAEATIVISSDQGKIYKYLEITTTISKTDIAKVKVRFKVEKSWVSSNSIDPNTIALNKLVNTTWEKLATKKISEDTINIFYEAEMSSLSIFAVTGQISTALITTTTTTTLPEGVTVTTLPRITTTTLEIVRPADVTLLIVLVVVAILVILALIFRRR